MAFEQFTSRARAVLADAARAGERLGRPVGTELLLLALYKDKEAAEILDALLDAAGTVRQGFVTVAQAHVAAANAQPGAQAFTPAAKSALELAMRQALGQSETVIAPRHMLLGILSSPDANATELLTAAGCEPGRVRAFVASDRSLRIEGLTPVHDDRQHGSRSVTETGARDDIPDRAFDAGYPHEGLQLGEYQLVGGAIAEPTMPGKAWVWKARHVPTSSYRVLKLYPLDDADAHQRTRCETEARMGKRWSRYREVVTTHFAGEIGGYYVIALRAMGRTLEEYIADRAKGRVAWQDAQTYAQWIFAIGSVLFLIHEAGDLHRDVTVRNILLSLDGEAVRLSDFSIGIDPDTARGTAVGEFLGTRGEFAPEHYRNEHSTAGDQYQLAFVAWQLFTGAPYPSESDRRLHPEVRVTLERGLAPDPTRRYANMWHFAAELQAATSSSIPWLIARLRHGPAALRRFSVRIVQVSCFMVPTMAWSYHQAWLKGPTAQALPAAVVGLVLLLAFVMAEMLYFVYMKRGAAEARARRTRWATGRLWLPFVGGGWFGIAFSEFAKNSGLSQFTLWLLPWLATAAAIGVQCLVGPSPNANEGRTITRGVEVLAGGSGKRRAIATLVLLIALVLVVSAASVRYIQS